MMESNFWTSAILYQARMIAPPSLVVSHMALISPCPSLPQWSLGLCLRCMPARECMEMF
eukprot:CCRYP_003835-RA/>CCRYP_003835-RA protein AED:0.08 eAED:0.08 QI:180/1/1/1/0/0/2/77/58